MQIIVAEAATEISQVRELMKEYWASFGFAPCFQNFDDEVAGLPGAYAPPRGRLGLALIENAPAGCVALKPFDATRCEAKRLYVRPQYRGLGLGRVLLDWIIAEARGIGFRELIGDTMPVMTQALAMYDRLGFERTGPYSENATPGAIYFRLKLDPS